MMAVIDDMQSLGMEPGAPVYASREALLNEV